MKKKITSLFSLLLIGIISMNSISFAANTKSVKVTYDDSIKIVSDGEIVDTSDKPKPVIIDGRLYLPVRSVEQAINRYSVKYDQKTRTIYFTDIANPNISNINKIENKSNDNISGNVKGEVIELPEFTEKYAHRIKGTYGMGRYYGPYSWDITNNPYNAVSFININEQRYDIINVFDKSDVEIELNDEFKDMEFLLASEDNHKLGGTVTILADNKVIYRENMEYGKEPKLSKLNLAGVKKLKIASNSIIIFNVKFTTKK